MRDRGVAKTTRFVTGLLLALALAAMGAPARAVDIKIASVAPDGSRWMQQMRAGAEEVSARTGGRVTVKFYPGGVMGNDAQVLRKIRIGQLQGGAFTAGGLGERYGALNLYGIPLLFRSLDEIYAMRAALDPELAAGLEQAGFVTFGFIAMEALGLSPAVLPVTDVLTGLQTGLIDIAFASPVAALVLQWHTKVKYITELPISYSMGIFAIEKGAYAALSADDQKILREVMSRYIVGLDREARDDNRRAAEVLASSGLQTVTVNAADVEVWRSTLESIQPQLRERPEIDSAMFDRLLAMLAEYRRTHP